MRTRRKDAILSAYPRRYLKVTKPTGFKLTLRRFDLDVVFAGEVGLLSSGEYADDFELLHRRGRFIQPYGQIF